MTWRRAQYNAERRTARVLGECAEVPVIWRVSNGLGWERVSFGYRSAQVTEVHVLPLADYRPHDETSACWCHPVEYELSTWGHFALDARDQHELGVRRVQ